MKRRWWRGALVVVGPVAVAALSVRWGLLDWLVADDGTVRNVMEGLSWPAGVAALLLAVSPTVRRWVAPGSQGPLSASAGSRDQMATLDTANPLVGRALHLVDGRLPEVGQVGLLQLRVKPAIDTHNEDGSDLPPYVGRDLDEDLEWAIAAGGMVLLHGRAAVGKSRAGIEALRRLRQHDPLLIPRDGPALRELVAADALPDGAVVWLDDLELYLAADGLDLALLQQLCPSGKPSRTVVVATMRDEELARHTIASAESDRVGAGIERAALDLIAQVQGRRRISVAADLSASERGRAEEVGERDGRVRRAVHAPEGFAEYLAAGTAMMDRWSIGDGPLFLVGQALISAAVDCRRAGYHKPVPTTLLGELHRHYMAPAWRHRDDLPTIAEALRWTHQPVLGASSCLQPRSEGAALASDYLLDRAQNGQAPLPKRVNDVLWLMLLDTISAVDAFPVGNAAYRADRFDVAQTAWEYASTASTNALTNLGIMLAEQGRTDEAADHFRRAGDAGNTKAMAALATLLANEGRVDEAERLYRRVVDAGDTRALTNLGLLLAEQERPDEAEEVYRRAVDAGHTGAMINLGLLLAEQERPDEAEELYRRAVDAGHTDAMVNLGLLLAEQERPDEAEEVYRCAVDAGDTIAMFNLGILLEEQERADEAEAIYRRAVDAGHTDAMINLGLLLAEQERPDEAEELYRRAVDAGDTGAMVNLGLLLAEQERPDEAEEVYRRAVDAGDTIAMFSLGLLLEDQERPDEAEEIYRRAVDAGHTDAMINLGILLEQQRPDEAEELYRRAVDAGDTTAMVNLGLLLEDRERPDEAEEIYRRAIDAGDTNAVDLLGVLLAEQRRTEAVDAAGQSGSISK